MTDCRLRHTFCKGVAAGFLAGAASVIFYFYFFSLPEARPNVPPPKSTKSIKEAKLLAVAFVRVVDGDTIKIIWKGDEVSVRMLNINTPERGKAGFTEATDYLKSLIGTETTLKLEFENDKPKRDRYGRLLAYVWNGHKNLCVEMVRAGYSKYWTKYGKGKYEAEFLKAEK